MDDAMNSAVTTCDFQSLSAAAVSEEEHIKNPRSHG